MSEAGARRTKRRKAEERSLARIDAAETTLRAELGLIFRIHALSNVITRRARTEGAETYGLTLVGWRVLMTVVLAPGLSGNEIVVLWGYEKMGVNRAIGTLIERGFVKRGADPDGGRRIPLLSTAAGRQFIADAWPLIRNFYGDLADQLTARQLDNFNDYSDKLLAQARKITEKP